MLLKPYIFLCRGTLSGFRKKKAAHLKFLSKVSTALMNILRKVLTSWTGMFLSLFPNTIGSIVLVESSTVKEQVVSLKCVSNRREILTKSMLYI